MKDDAMKRITTYYELLAQKESNPMAAKTMNKMIEQMSDDDVVALEEKLVANDKQYDRIMAYINLLSSYMMAAEPTMSYGLDAQGKNAKVMNELNDAFDGYDMDRDIYEEINGNSFSFKKDFPIDQYREELEAIGDEEKGNQWYVKLDEGRLVIY